MFHVQKRKQGNIEGHFKLKYYNTFINSSVIINRIFYFTSWFSEEINLSVLSCRIVKTKTLIKKVCTEFCVGYVNYTNEAVGNTRAFTVLQFFEELTAKGCSWGNITGTLPGIQSSLTSTIYSNNWGNISA